MSLLRRTHPARRAFCQVSAVTRAGSCAGRQRAVAARDAHENFHTSTVANERKTQPLLSACARAARIATSRGPGTSAGATLVPTDPGGRSSGSADRAAGQVERAQLCRLACHHSSRASRAVQAAGSSAQEPPGRSCREGELSRRRPQPAAEAHLSALAGGARRE